MACSGGRKDQVYDREEPEQIYGDLIIFHAGSLSVPFKEMGEAFTLIHPEVNIMMESAGSVASIRKITDLNKPCDILASADYSLIDELLIPTYCDWNIHFASNEMVIAYNEKSKYNEGINPDNWLNILLKEEVTYGRSDPDSDPCGYRTILTMKLAGRFYNKPEFADLMMKKDRRYLRPKEVDLLALLETNTIDYIFIYRSVAEQHQLKYLVLPDEINLKNPLLKDMYSQAGVEIVGKTPEEKIRKQGEPMVYGITILNNAPNDNAAKAFLRFLLDPSLGREIMQKNGQPSVIPDFTDSYHRLPEEFKMYAKNSR